MLRIEWLPRFRDLLDRPPREIYIAGTPDAEPAVYRALSLAKARLGTRFTSLPIRVVPLAECEQPDFIIRGGTRHARRWVELRGEIHSLLIESQPHIQRSTILSACGIPVPHSLFQHAPPLTFSPLVDEAGEPLPLWSIPAQWTAAEIVFQTATESPEAIRQAAHFNAQEYPRDSQLRKFSELTG